MSRPFSVLGLDADADERAIKRAYAAKLKTVRPDEDPEGFQRLNEAYRAALRWAQSRPADTADRIAPAPDGAPPQPEPSIEASPGAHEPRCPAPAPPSPPAHLQVRRVAEIAPTEPVEAAESVESAEPAASAPPPLAQPPFDAARFHYGFALAAANASPQGFSRWLDMQPELLSLQLKARLSRSLLAFLAQEQPPMRQDNFDAFCACFGYDDIASGQDAMQLRALARRLHRVWQAEDGERHGVTIAIPCDDSGWPSYGAERGEARIASMEQRMRDTALAAAAWTRFPELRRPAWSWIEMGLLCLVFGRERRIAELLRQHGQETWPAGTNRRVADFWRDVADRTRPTFARRFQRMARVLGYGGTAAGLIAFAWLGDGGVPLLRMIWIMLGMAGVALSILLMRALVEWQTLPAPPGRFGRALHYGTIPALLLATFVLGEIPPYVWSPVPAAFAAGIALLRYRHRKGVPSLASLIHKYLPWTGVRALLLVVLVIGIGPTWQFVVDSPWGVPLLSWSLGLFAAGFWAKDAAQHLREARRV